MAVQVISSSYTDGPALTAAARASCVPTYVPTTLPAGYFQIGRVLRWTMSGRISCAVTTPGTARFDLSIATIAAFDTGAIPLNIVAKTSVSWFFQAIMTVRAVGTGTTANLIGQGFWLSEAAFNTPLPATGPGPGGVLVPFNTSPVVGSGFNSGAANALDFNFTQTVATGSLTVHQHLLEQLTP